MGSSRPNVSEHKPGNTGTRLFLACGAAGLSLYLNLSHPSGSPSSEVNPISAFVGFVIGCGVLAVFVYWLAGKVGPVTCAFWLAPVVIINLVIRGSCTSSTSAVQRSAPTAVAARAAVTAPDVPPLLRNETPPSDGPNYFEPREVSSGGIVTGLDFCEASARKNDPSLNADVLSAYCTCFVDVYRRNMNASGDMTKATPTMDQIKKCAAAARSGNPSPFAFASPRATSDVSKEWADCVRDYGDRHHGVYCDCVVDLLTLPRLTLTFGTTFQENRRLNSS